MTAEFGCRFDCLQAAPIPTPKQQHIHSGIAILSTHMITLAAITPPTIPPIDEVSVMVAALTVVDF